MELTVPMTPGILLKFTTGSHSGKKYPTAGLQKGFLLVHEGHDLAEEGVGFGVPILKQGIHTIFPGSAALISIEEDPQRPVTQVAVNYRMNLEERIESVNSKFLYTIKNFLAVLIRRIPLSRYPLTSASNALRWMFGLQTTYEEAGFCTEITAIYFLDREAGTFRVEIDAANLDKYGITEVVVMNEQGAHAFDQFCDSNGTNLVGNEINCWDKVTSEWARFASTSHRLAFTLRQAPGATLFRGRELVGARLAWSGFGISFSPAATKISYQLKIEALE